MKLSVFKNNLNISNIDLSKEIFSMDNTETSFFIGRSNECHIVIDDRQVSREHAVITCSNGNWKIKQISEFNPLSVNGNVVDEEALSDGDIISIGIFNIQVQIGPYDVSQDSRPAIDSEHFQESTEETEIKPGEEEDSQFDDDHPDPETVETDKDAHGVDDDVSAPFDETHDNGYSFEQSDDGEETANDYPMDHYDGEDSSEESTKAFVTFSSIELDLFGENVPYDKYKVEKNETIIGRDPAKCAIVLKDGEVSSIHAKIIREKAQCKIKDMNSANGTILNGSRISESKLVDGDEFIIGGTTFTIHIVSSLMESEKDRLMPVEENQVVEVEEVVEVDSTFSDEDLLGPDQITPEQLDKPKSIFSKKFILDPANRKKVIIYAVAGFFLLVLLFSGEEDTSTPTGKSKKSTGVVKVKDMKKKGPEKKFTPEEIEFLDSQYTLSKELFDTGKYSEAIFELEKIFARTKEYKKSREIYEMAQRGVAKLEELEKKRQEKIERQLRMKKIRELLKKAEMAVKDRKVELAESFFQQIFVLDPDTDEVLPLKNELNAWRKEQERIALEKEQKKAERRRMVNALAPGKRLYQRKVWHEAITELERFLKIDKMKIDEDLIKEGSKMLATSQNELNKIINPLMDRAANLFEGRDLKGAYETYSTVLKHAPNNIKSRKEKARIRETLMLRARKVYREALISESLSLFQDAKEKLQEVQQIAPSDSDYYHSASEKLKEYLE